MPEENVTVPTPPKDFAPKLKFAVTIGAQLFIGLIGIAATAAVTIYVAKNITPALVINIPAES